MKYFLFYISLILWASPLLGNGNKFDEPPTNKYTIVEADIASGIIGTDKNNPTDIPADNIFKINLDNAPQSGQKVWLQYELKGAQDYTAVAHSINDRQAFGGNFVQTTQTWNEQREAVHFSWLKKGENIIRFAAPKNAGFTFEIKNLKVVTENNTAFSEEADIIINQPSKKYYNNRGYLKGFLTGKEFNIADLYINDKLIELNDGEFEVILDKPNKAKHNWQATLKAVFPNGKKINKIIHFNKNEKADHEFSFAQKGNFTLKNFSHSQTNQIKFQGLQLDVPRGALKENKLFSVTALRNIDIPAMNSDLINVTAQTAAYRLLPHGIQFLMAADLKMNYNPALIPDGYTAEDIRTFYFDENAKRWIQLKKDSLLTHEGSLISKTTHFTDFITGIIKVPESPETQGYESTSIKDIKAADPSAEIIPIEAPQANNMGTANLQYPIKLPSGRNGMQPSIAIQYNSEGGNSWLGLGWNLSTPSVSIETRWGAPRYDTNLETETYLLNGMQLTPMAHREEWVSRTAEKQFHPRVEGAFQEIIRHGDNPKNYWWEVTDKEGTKNFYGGHPNSGIINNAVLKDIHGNIAHWNLVETRDLNNNFVRYHYTIVEDTGLAGGTASGFQIYLDKITYTGYGNTEGLYSVHFVRDRQLNESKRTDITINGRLGFKQVTADLLRNIEVKFNSDMIRSYELTYMEGAFFKTLLKDIIEYDKNGAEFYRHELEYYDEVRQNGTYQPYSANQNWNVPADNVEGDIINPISDFDGHVSLLSGSESDNWSVTGALTFGIMNFRLMDKSLTLGGNYTYNNSESNGLISLVDINGDGLPDKVFKGANGLYYRPNLSAPSIGLQAFGAKTKINGISEFSTSQTRGSSKGFEAHPGPAFIGYTKTKSKTVTKTYFIDYNGDGLIDIAHKGRIYFNHINSDGHPEFSTSSSFTPSPVLAGSFVNPALQVIDPNEQDSLIDEFPLHDLVRVWVAPYSGIITIDAPINLAKNNSPDAMEYTKKDGIRAAIQKNGAEIWSVTIAANDYGIKTPLFPGSISVNEGDKLYFRLQSIFDGAYDQVFWDPAITYDSADVPHSERDANDNAPAFYKASNDFSLASYQRVTMPLKGKIRLMGDFTKQATSDYIKVQIVMNDGNTVIASWDFADSFETTVAIDTVLEVEAFQEYQFMVTSSTNIDWQAIQWMPHFYYTEAVDENGAAVQVTGNNGPLFDYCPTVEYSMFNHIVKRTPIWTAPDTGLLEVKCYINFPPAPFQFNGEGEVTLSIKGRNKLYAKKTFSVFPSFIPQPIIVQDSILEGDDIYIEYHYSIPDLGELLFPYLQTNRTFNGATETVIETGLFTHIENINFGPLYRGWGQFVYNGNRERANEAIHEGDLKLDDALTNPPPIPDDPDQMNGLHDPTKSNFIMMAADAKQQAWIGLDNLTYVKADTMSSSRMGEDDIKVEIEITAGGSNAFAPNKISRSKSKSYALSVVSLGGSKGDGTSETEVEVMDFNGDRIPDVAGKNEIQHSDPRGGLRDELLNHNLGPHQSENSTFGLNIGGSFNIPKSVGVGGSSGQGSPRSSSQAAARTDNTSNASEDGANTATFAVNASGSVSDNRDNATQTWLDINGDGLVDKVYSNGEVALSYGYYFGPKEPWGHTAIRVGKGDDIGGGLGLGVNFVNGSIRAGISLTKSENETVKALQDINGDGLADMITWHATNDVTVNLNLGNGFSSDIPWIGVTHIEKGASIGESVNAGFTIGIPIFCVFVPCFKVCINPGGSIGQGVSRQEVQFSDIDGDGFPDLLQSDNEDELKAKQSTIGKTNLLKKVTRPMGAYFTLEYERTGNTYDLQSSKWLLTAVESFDGHTGDGADFMKYRFAYEQPFYHRHEREFYGFAKTTSQQLDTENNNTVYRSVEQVYDNSTFYKKGLLLSESMLDGMGNKYKETVHTYQLKDIQTGANISNDFNAPSGNAYPAMIAQKELYYEGQAAAGIEQLITYEYDAIGNVVKYTDYGDNTAADFLEATITYHDTHVFPKSSPASIEVFTADGLIRKRESEIDANGNVVQIRQFLENGEAAIHDMEYNDLGNLTKITRPENHQGERLHFEYEYDNTLQTYVTEVRDGYGYTSQTTYDLSFGKPLETIDMNGQKMVYTLDDKGRTSTITGPYELANGQPYTIAFSYHPDATVAYAVTKHFEPEYGSDIVTYTFMDGLFRPLQVKKTGSIFAGSGSDDHRMMIVSGRTIFDAFGRNSENYYPVTETLGSETIFNNNFSSIAPTLLTYDVLDRTLTTTLPDGSATKTTYEIAPDNSNHPTFKTTVKDALNNVKEHFADVRGRTRATADHGPDGTIWTSFRYNAIAELQRIIDHSGYETIFNYDHLGRKLSRLHPDAGLTEMKYDMASNLIEKTTPNIREATPNGGKIKYIYEKERLIETQFPQYLFNNVKYTYGALDADHNRVGRIVLQEDASGGQEFFYGPLGEVTKNIRTMVINQATMLTFISEYEYDTWARIQKMTYPDGETVDYEYNTAGKLQRMTAQKNGQDYTIIEQLSYDEFEQRVFCQYGNGTETRYTYEADRRRLSKLFVQSKTGRPIMSNTYEYDVVNNVLSIENNTVVNGQFSLGGPASHLFTYDKLYRLTQASGSFEGNQQKASYDLLMAYDNLHNIEHKTQALVRNGTEVAASSYANDYSYETARPHVVNKVGEKEYTYDANGNLEGWSVDNHFSFRQLIWDEEDRLRGINDNGNLSQYTYDAAGERAIKSNGGIQGVFLDGALSGFVDHQDNYTAYVSPYLVAKKGSFTKHYYVEGQRVLSKLGSGKFNNNVLLVSNGVTAGNKDYVQKVIQLQSALQQYYGQTVGGPPGEPTILGYYQSTAQTGNPVPDFSLTDYTRPPAGWPLQPVLADPNNAPSAPVQFVDSLNQANVAGGYGFENTTTPESFQYFYHPDHLGSTSYITDALGEVSQHVEYIPFGETLIEEHTSSDLQPYLFNGKELDRETGLYYYGARYYDPVTSIWLSVDPLADQYAGWSPYNYTLLNPVKYNDPDGRFANLVVGGIAGGTIDYASQVASNLYNGNGLSSFTTNIDMKSIGISAATGVATSGLGPIVNSAKFIKGPIAKVLANIAGEIGINTLEKGAKKLAGVEGYKDMDVFSSENIKEGVLSFSMGKFFDGKAPSKNTLKGIGKNFKEGKKGVTNLFKGKYVSRKSINAGKNFFKKFGRGAVQRTGEEFIKKGAGKMVELKAKEAGLSN